MSWQKPDNYLAKKGREYLVAITGFSPTTVTRCVESGELPGRIIAGCVVLTEPVLDRWLETLDTNHRSAPRLLTPEDMKRKRSA
jgi:hypothetical protein